MKSPFPGMDPYLEQHWRDIHASLVIYTRDQLQEQLPGDLFAQVEERVFLESDELSRRSMYPDVRIVEYPGGGLASSGEETGLGVAEPVLIHYGDEPVTETYVEIIDASTGQRVITVVEFLSLSNKFPGEAQNQYLQKQKESKQARVSLVEIDLLRDGRRVLSLPVTRIPHKLRTAYQVCVRRGWKPDVCEIYPVPLRQGLPTIRIPLRETDADARLDLQTLIDQAYRNGRYNTLDYKGPPEPPLPGEDETWTDVLLRQAGKR